MKSILRIALAVGIAILGHGVLILALGGVGIIGSAGDTTEDAAEQNRTSQFRVRLAEAELSIGQTSQKTQLVLDAAPSSPSNILVELEKIDANSTSVNITTPSLFNNIDALAKSESRYVASKLSLNLKAQRRLLPDKFPPPFESPLLLSPTDELMQKKPPVIDINPMIPVADILHLPPGLTTGPRLQPDAK